MMPDEQNVTSCNVFSGRDEDGLPFAEDLFSARPAASPAEVRDTMRAAMGEEVTPAPAPAGSPGCE